MSNLQTGTQGVFNMVLPANPQVVPQYLDLTTASEIDVDLSQLVDNGTIDFISGVWVNNGANSVAINIQVYGSNQHLTIPPYNQAYLPVLCPNNPKFRVYCDSSPGLIIETIFHNIPLLPIVYASQANSEVYVLNETWLTDTQLRASPVPVTRAAPTIADRSIASMTGVSQTLVSAGQASNYLLVQNPVGNAAVKINLAGGNAAAVGISVLGGGSYELQNGCANAVTISGTVTQAITAFAG